MNQLQLHSLQYSEFSSQPNEWELSKSEFGKINLIVGKNASGKSRVISVITGLSGLLSGAQKGAFLSGKYDVLFECNHNNYAYQLNMENNLVISETLHIDDDPVLERSADGSGVIKATEANESRLKFKVQPSQIAAYAKRDALQHPFLEDLYNWASSLKYYGFGTHLGRRSLAIINNPNDPSFIENALNDANQVTGLLFIALNECGEELKKAVIEDMNEIGYECSDIGLEHNAKFAVSHNEQIPLSIYVQEKELNCHTNQIEMSQGMFRALSLLIQINYSILSKKKLCVLIDDIGEGLDFERATSLISIIYKKASSNLVQLIMSTNDRFTMNSIDLKYWSIINRKGSKVELINYQKSPEVFEQFKFIGLSNFDFFAKDIYLEK